MVELKHIVLSKEFKERLRWLIQIRWIAVVLVFIVLTVVIQFITPSLPALPLYIGNLILLGYNIAFHLYDKIIEKEQDVNIWFRKARIFSNIQIAFDFLLLSYFIHFAGGLENPFIFFFIFNIVIASMLLSKRAVFFQAGMAIFYMGLIGYLETSKLIPHYHLAGFLPGATCPLSLWYSLGIWIAFSSTLLITGYMATSIVDRLRAGEQELAAANDKLAEQDRIKSQYVLTVSHDMQVSLAAIQSCLKVVLSDLTGAISDKAREMIGRAEQRSTHLLAFVKDLLNLSKIRASETIQLKNISIKQVLTDAMDELAADIETKRLQMDIKKLKDETVRANPELLEHAIINLISNAVKYTPQGGNIQIFSSEANDASFYKMSIKDNGIGIPDEARTHIFEDFYRGENALILDKNGTGLGLSIVKQILDTIGGNVWVDSEMGSGSTFSITLPKAHPTPHVNH